MMTPRHYQPPPVGRRGLSVPAGTPVSTCGAVPRRVRSVASDHRLSGHRRLSTTDRCQLIYDQLVDHRAASLSELFSGARPERCAADPIKTARTSADRMGQWFKMTADRFRGGRCRSDRLPSGGRIWSECMAKYVFKYLERVLYSRTIAMPGFPVFQGWVSGEGKSEWLFRCEQNSLKRLPPSDPAELLPW